MIFALFKIEFKTDSSKGNLDFRKTGLVLNLCSSDRYMFVNKR